LQTLLDKIKDDKLSENDIRQIGQLVGTEKTRIDSLTVDEKTKDALVLLERVEACHKCNLFPTPNCDSEDIVSANTLEKIYNDVRAFVSAHKEKVDKKQIVGKKFQIRKRPTREGYVPTRQVRRNSQSKP
jgi:hypothetical protein